MYNISTVTANMASLLYLIILPVATPLANYVIDTYGMSISVKIGTILTVIGAWFKIFINEFFEIVLIGTIFVALGSPFIINTKTKVAGNWFRPPSWAVVTMTVTFLSLINTIMSIILPGLFFIGYELE
jgi:FLVCR family feline leukemia virus subgroup C receptor-related protein